jgi:hypothetical protein
LQTGLISEFALFFHIFICELPPLRQPAASLWFAAMLYFAQIGTLLPTGHMNE